jgi:nitrogenase molybdenum-iron protein alpha chain
MAKKINLDMTSVENREMRLGTIIAWDGAASELVKESDYEGRKEKKKGNTTENHGGCCGNGSKACRLCELKTPLNQQTMCANAMLSRAGYASAVSSATAVMLTVNVSL